MLRIAADLEACTITLDDKTAADAAVGTGGLDL
jgi:hypothetical protein